MQGCRPPAADCLRASAQRTLEAQNTGVDFTRPAVKQVYEVMTTRLRRNGKRFRGIARMLASGFFHKETVFLSFPEKKKEAKEKPKPADFIRRKSVYDFTD